MCEPAAEPVYKEWSVAATFRRNPSPSVFRPLSVKCKSRPDYYVTKLMSKRHKNNVHTYLLTILLLWGQPNMELIVWFDSFTWRSLQVISSQSRFPLMAIESFTNEDGEGNEKVKKATGVWGKTTNLQLHHTFVVHIPCRLCTTTTWKCIISRFMEDVNKRRRSFLSLSKL